jgi:hypothetical protein
MNFLHPRPQSQPLHPESSAVQAHLNILQGIISRMASNSASCKTWCITLILAIFVTIAAPGKLEYIWIAWFPTIVFLLLDAYYLGQERAFRQSYNHFVDRMHQGIATRSDLFVVAPLKGFNVVKETFSAIRSFAIYPFYLTLIAGIAIAQFLLSHP